VAKPWNFLCKKQQKVQKTEDEEVLLAAGQEKDERNFEPVDDACKRQE
jgi:hypothetical protein